MARFWKEKLDLDKHVDYMKTTHLSGFPVAPSHDNIRERWVYFVTVCSFTFQFQSIEQIQECLTHFEQKTHPSSALPNVTLEHCWQGWEQRLPYRLFENSKRQKSSKLYKTPSLNFKFELVQVLAGHQTARRASINERTARMMKIKHSTFKTVLAYTAIG